MPNSHTVTEFAARIEQIGRAAQKSQRKGVERAALLIKREIEKELTRAIGGDHVLTNLRKKSGQPAGELTLGYDIKGTLNPTALLRAKREMGGWKLVEYGSERHGMFPRGWKVRKGTRREKTQRSLDVYFGRRGALSGLRPMPINGNFRYAVRNHPGTRGKEPFHKGLARATPQAVKELHATVHAAVVDVIRSGRQTYVYVRGEVGAYTPKI